MPGRGHESYCEFNREIGRIIARQRKHLGMTLQGLGDKIGVTSSVIFNYEVGERAPSLVSTLRLMDVLNLDIAELKSCLCYDTKGELKTLAAGSKHSSTHKKGEDIPRQQKQPSV